METRLESLATLILLQHELEIPLPRRGGRSGRLSAFMHRFQHQQARRHRIPPHHCGRGASRVAMGCASEACARALSLPRRRYDSRTRSRRRSGHLPCANHGSGCSHPDAGRYGCSRHESRRCASFRHRHSRFGSTPAPGFASGRPRSSRLTIPYPISSALTAILPRSQNAKPLP
jgi:hypothetical protein